MISQRIAIILFLVIFGTSYWINAMNIGSFHNNGILNDDTKKLFSVLGESFETLEQANDFAQENLLRTGERWDEQEETLVLNKCKKYENILMTRLKALGMVDAVRPLQKHFKYALCMGALIQRVRQRLDSIVHLQNDGYSFDQIVLLGGARPLRESEKHVIPNDIDTEIEMMQYLYDNHEKLKRTKLMVVNAPMVTLSNGNTRRPNTDDTLNYFVTMASENGSCLIISDNPYLFRQAKVAQRILDQKKFPTYGAGQEFDPKKVDIFVVIDELARAIYEEYRLSKGT